METLQPYLDQAMLYFANVPIEAATIPFLLLIIFAALRSRKARKIRQANLRSRQIAQVEAMEKVEQAERMDENVVLPIVVYPMPVIELTEERVFDALEDLAGQSVMGHRVLMSLPLSSFLYAKQPGATREQEAGATRSLRAAQIDFLIVDADWNPIVAVDLERDDLTGAGSEASVGEACEYANILYLRVGPGGPTEAQEADIKARLGVSQGIAAE